MIHPAATIGSVVLALGGLKLAEDTIHMNLECMTMPNFLAATVISTKNLFSARR